VVVELASIHRIAKKEGQYGVCINALLALARIGKLIDSTPGPRSVSQTLNVNGLTPDTLRTILRQNLGALPEAEQKQLSAAAGDILDAELLEPLSTTRAEAAPGESV
jgi:hypothetical protein